MRKIKLSWQLILYFTTIIMMADSELTCEEKEVASRCYRPVSATENGTFPRDMAAVGPGWRYLHQVADGLALRQDVGEVLGAEHVPQRRLRKQACRVVRVLHVCHRHSRVVHPVIDDGVDRHRHRVLRQHLRAQHARACHVRTCRTDVSYTDVLYYGRVVRTCHTDVSYGLVIRMCHTAITWTS